MDLVEETRPTQCTHVPVSPGELTSHRGWDARRHGYWLQPVISRLKSWGVRVALFVEAVPETMQDIAALAPDRIELYTGPYASAFKRGDYARELDALVKSAAEVEQRGVEVNAGHDLTVANLQPFIAAIPSVREVSIGHYFMLDALQVGIAESVRRFMTACRPA